MSSVLRYAGTTLFMKDVHTPPSNIVPALRYLATGTITDLLKLLLIPCPLISAPHAGCVPRHHVRLLPMLS